MSRDRSTSPRIPPLPEKNTHIFTEDINTQLKTMGINISDEMLQYLLTNDHSDIFTKRQKIDSYFSSIEKSVNKKKKEVNKTLEASEKKLKSLAEEIQILAKEIEGLEQTIKLHVPKSSQKASDEINHNLQLVTNKKKLSEKKSELQTKEEQFKNVNEKVQTQKSQLSTLESAHTAITILLVEASQQKKKYLKYKEKYLKLKALLNAN